MTARRLAIVAVAVLAALLAAGFAVVWRPAIAAIDPPDRRTFAPEVVRRGADLAALGNCNVCHTAPGGKSLAGGVALTTPFGTIYSTNITPDPETGIGRWPEAAFRRAMREGVDRPGATTMAVMLSACTTLLGFGLLSFSNVPALQHFGIALATTVAGSLAFAPLALKR